MKIPFIFTHKLLLCLGLIVSSLIRPAAESRAYAPHEAQESMSERIKTAMYGGRQSRLNARLHEAIQKEDLPSLRLLIEQGASSTALNETGWTPLMAAATMGNHAIVRELLALDTTDSVNWSGPEGWKALMFACACGKPKIVSDLLAAGANNTINAQDADLHSALFYAINFCTEKEAKVEIVRMLLTAGAQDSIMGNSIANCPLKTCINNGDLDIATELLLSQAKIDLTDHNMNLAPLIAFNRGLYDVAGKFIIAGADFHVTNEKGLTIFGSHYSTTNYAW